MFLKVFSVESLTQWRESIALKFVNNSLKRKKMFIKIDKWYDDWRFQFNKHFEEFSEAAQIKDL